MKIDNKLNLVVQVEGEEGTLFVHSMPLSRMVWERYFVVLSKTFSAMIAEGMSFISGPRIAALMLRKVADHYPAETLDFVLAHLDTVRGIVDGPAWSRYVPSLVHNSVDPAMPGRVRAFAASEFAGMEHRDADRAALALEVRLEDRQHLLPALDAWMAGAH